jgi:hypothetical protein
MKNSKIITNIKDIEEVNIELVREATRQVELRFCNENEKKQRIDNRAGILLGALAGLIALSFPVLKSEEYVQSIILLIGKFIVCLPFFSIYKIFMPADYGDLGTFPITWMSEEYNRVESSGNLNKDINETAKIMIYILLNYQKSLEVSTKTNCDRVKQLRTALLFSSFSLLITIILSSIDQIFTIFSIG